MRILNLLVISYLLSAYFSRAIHFEDNFKLRNETESVIRTMFPLFYKSSSLCVVSSNSELLSIFFEVSRDYLIPVLLSDSKVAKSCTSIVVLESSLPEDCVMFTGTYNPSMTSYYLFSYWPVPLSSQLERCLSHSWSAEVLVVSLREGTFYQLSPVFPTPRHFIPSTADRVMQLKPKPNMPNLRGEGVKVVTLYYPPFVIFKLKKSKIYILDELDGIGVTILKQMALKMNFTVNNITVSDESWGLLLPNNTFTGGFGQAMQDGTADIVLENVWYLPRLLYAADFGPAMNQFEWSFLTTRPTQVPFQWISLLSIYQWEVQLASLASFMVVVVAYWVGVNCDIRQQRESFTGCVMVVFGYLTMTCSQTREGNTRFTLTSWSVFALLFTTSLSTVIVQRLTLPAFTARVDTVQQLVEGGYYWTAIYYGQLNDTSRKSTFFNLENYWDYLFEKRYRYLSRKEVAERAGVDLKMTFPASLLISQNEKNIVLSTSGLAAHKALPGYRSSKATVLKLYTTCFAVRKHSPLFEPFAWIANIFMETGLVHHWWDEVYHRWPEHDNRHLLKERDRPVFSEPQPLRLERIQALFYMLLLGLVLATLVFVMEVTLNRL